ncbi:MAG: hypothetical protein HRU15_19045 [Planctomycetes bacterium]|nr:hypothetical protein [Planctomycetota bacterium]
MICFIFNLVHTAEPAPQPRDPFYSIEDMLTTERDLYTSHANSKDTTNKTRKATQNTSNKSYDACLHALENERWSKAMLIAKTWLHVHGTSNPTLAKLFQGNYDIAQNSLRHQLREEAFSQEQIHIQGILWSEAMPSAIINNSNFCRGDAINEYLRITHINKNSIIVQFTHSGSTSEHHIYLR